MTVGRFAPSPTSELHLGNLRTALLAWLFARADGGDFVVRIEDLDQQRVAAAPGVAAGQLADLAALGLDWDADPVRQSERQELYRAAASRLDSYECFCTRRDIAEASQAPQTSGGQAAAYRRYPGTCAHLSDAERAARRRERVPAIRVRANGATVTVHDRHAGEVTGMVDDFVLFRADGTPAYHLAAVVDDGLQGITQVTRGDDLLDSSPRQAWLASQLGFAVPEYVHVGLALSADGRRLAKRDGAVTLGDQLALGRRPDEVVAMLAASAGLPAAGSASEVLAAGPDLDHPQIWQPWIVTV